MRAGLHGQLLSTPTEARAASSESGGGTRDLSLSHYDKSGQELQLASKCEFGRQELGFLLHCLSATGVSVDPRKVPSILEWATPTSARSYSKVRRFTGLDNYYRSFVEGYAEVRVAAPLTALGSPTRTWTASFVWSPSSRRVLRL